MSPGVPARRAAKPASVRVHRLTDPAPRGVTGVTEAAVDRVSRQRFLWRCWLVAARSARGRAGLHRSGMTSRLAARADRVRPQRFDRGAEGCMQRGQHPGPSAARLPARRRARPDVDVAHDEPPHDRPEPRHAGQRLPHRCSLRATTPTRRLRRLRWIARHVHHGRHKRGTRSCTRSTTATSTATARRRRRRQASVAGRHRSRSRGRTTRATRSRRSRRPRHLVATCRTATRPSQSRNTGLLQPSNIIQKHPQPQADDHYYLFTEASADDTMEQQYGACLLRTRTLDDPASWRAWDGAGFNIRFVDPYAEPGGAARDAPVPAGLDLTTRTSCSAQVTYNSYLGRYVLIDVSGKYRAQRAGFLRHCSRTWCPASTTRPRPT